MAASEFEKAMTAAVEDLKKVNEEHGVKQKGGRVYTMVSHRTEVFRRHFPSLGILTEVVKWEPEDNGYVVMKATITNFEGMPLATGHAEERRDDGHVNATSALENCETSAIGRALAAFGLHGGEFASADELASAIGAEKAQATKKGGGIPKAKAAPEPEPEPEPKGIEHKWPDGSASTYEDYETLIQEAIDSLTDCKTVEDVDAIAKSMRPHKPSLTADQNSRLTEAFAAQRDALTPKEEPKEEPKEDPKAATKKAPAKKAPAKKADADEGPDDGPGWDAGEDAPEEYDEDGITAACDDYNKDGLPLVKVDQKALSLVYAVFSAFLPACESKDEMIRWWKANTGALEWLEKYGPNLYSSLIDEFKARKAELEG